MVITTGGIIMKLKNLSAIAVLILMIGACILNLSSCDTKNKDVEILRMQSDIAWDKVSQYIVSSMVSEVENTESGDVEIPVYLEDELLFNNDGILELGIDNTSRSTYSTGYTLSYAIISKFPTSAIRKRSDNSVYMMYDTETGYRLYLQYISDNDYFFNFGYPIVLKKMLSYKDFSKLKKDDPIEKVEAIDPVTTLYKRALEESNPQYTARIGVSSLPNVSFHYLKDGLLKIQYKLLEDGSFSIFKITFTKGHTLKDAHGNLINYEINDEDLP